MSKVLIRFLEEESGATAIEYGLVAAGIAVVIITSLGTVSCSLNRIFFDIAGKLKTG